MPGVHKREEERQNPIQGVIIRGWEEKGPSQLRTREKKGGEERHQKVFKKKRREMRGGFQRA